MDRRPRSQRTPLAAGLLAALLLAAPAASRVELTHAPTEDLLLAIHDLAGGEGGAERWRVALGSTAGGPARTLAAGFDPAWSPDGTRIAFAAVPSGMKRGEIYVMLADGTQRRRLTRTPPSDRVPTWSPNGKALAFLSGGRLAIISSTGGELRYLSGETPAEAAWSPKGDMIAFTTGEQGDRDIVVSRVDGSARTVLPDPAVSGASWHEETPRWSPDGTLIAFGRRYQSVGHGADVGGLWVASPDGANARSLIEWGACCPRWSASGREFLVVAEERACVRTYCVPAPADIGVIAVNGTGMRLLTGDVARDKGPSWSKGERHVVFVSERSRRLDPLPHDDAYVMNADGTCQTRVTRASYHSSVAAATLRPGRSVNGGRRLSCVDLGLAASWPAVVPSGARFAAQVTVANRGDRVAAPSTIRIERPAADLVAATGAGARCTVVRQAARCELPRLRPGRKLVVSLVLETPRNRAEGAAPWRGNPNYEGGPSLKLVGRSGEGDLANNVLDLRYLVSACSFFGSDNADVIVGTRQRDVICAYPGDDDIRTLGGDDRIKAGDGADTIDPGSGRDVVGAGPGSDTINAVDGEVDRIVCGEGADDEVDKVRADADDKVGADCEVVERS